MDQIARRDRTRLRVAAALAVALCAGVALSGTLRTAGVQSTTSDAVARQQSLAGLRARIQQLQTEMTLNASAQQDPTLSERQRQGLQLRAAQITQELASLRTQEAALLR